MILPNKSEKAVDEKAVDRFINQKTGTPKKQKKDEMPTVAFKIDPVLNERVIRAAKKLGISRSAFIKAAITSVLDNNSLNVKLDWQILQ